MNDWGEREPGLRDRKKAATRRTLLQTAARMFAERGYQETTVKDIASAAGVTERTFFRYFPSKEDLVFAEVLDLVPLLRREIPRRPAGEPPLTAVLNGLVEAAGALDEGLAILFVGTPPRALPTGARRTHVLTDFEDGIADALVVRLAEQHPDEPDDRRARRAAVLARVSVAVIRSALLAHVSEDAAGPERRSVDDFGTLLREAFDAVREAV
ncbi:hypothetical protein BKI49_28085 [Streptomyces sp. Tue6028]|uniref:HTH tetR-type domain-containing protein n=1 Tax=Streptomyces siamensis TaxID=1274986 RepID=A0ABP9JCK2_9ACTN|nr:TetR family transcriptional regulator [Streptomyces sp. Tue6028]PBC60388.1 hypothetical protein BKI49_28085 [Streptomyces sp. Tue6028]